MRTIKFDTKITESLVSSTDQIIGLEIATFSSPVLLSFVLFSLLVLSYL